MNIKSSVESMKQQVNSMSDMGTMQAWALEFVADLAVRVINTDAITFEYSMTNGDETFTTHNQSVFCNVLEWALS